MSQKPYDNSSMFPNSTVFSDYQYNFTDCGEDGQLYFAHCVVQGEGGDYLSRGALIAVTVVYSVVFLVGVLGNVAVGLAVWGRKELRKATNYFLVNLSVADLLLLLVCMPISLLETWVPMPWLLGETMCKLVPYLEMVVFQASVLTIVAVSIERYLGLTHPLRARSMCTTSRTWKAVILLWVTSLLAASPVLSIAEMKTYEGGGITTEVCDTKVDKPWKMAYVLTNTTLFFVMPMILLCVLYSLIGRKMIGTCRLNSEEASDSLADRQRSRRRVVYMMATVVVVFFVSLLPQRVVQLWLVFAPIQAIMDFGPHGVEVLIIFLRIMLYLNSTLNPIIYTLFSTQFRTAFLHIVRIRKKSQSVQTTNSRFWIVRHRDTLELYGKGVNRTNIQQALASRRSYPMLPITTSLKHVAMNDTKNKTVATTAPPVCHDVRESMSLSMIPTINFSSSDRDSNDTVPKNETVGFPVQNNDCLKLCSEYSRMTSSTSLKDVNSGTLAVYHDVDTDTPMSKSF